MSAEVAAALLSGLGLIGFSRLVMWLLERQQRKRWDWLSKDPTVALQQLRDLARLEREIQRRIGRFKRGDFSDLGKPYPKVRGVPDSLDRAGEP